MKEHKDKAETEITLKDMKPYEIVICVLGALFVILWLAGIFTSCVGDIYDSLFAGPSYYD